MPYRITIATEPAAEPITLAQAKTHLRRLDGYEDDYITDMIRVARRILETKMRRAFINQTWDLKLDKFPPNGDPVATMRTELERRSQIRIPRPPLSSVTYIKYIDTGGTEQTFSSDNYTVDTNSEPGRVYPAHGQIWPETQNIENAVTIRFVAGYGSSGDNVPAEIKHAIKLMIGHWMQHREVIAVGTITKEIEVNLKALIWSQRIYEVP